MQVLFNTSHMIVFCIYLSLYLLPIYLSIYLDTAVLQVRASDRDDPETGAGQILFSIVSTHNKFKINPQTGWISTNKVGLGLVVGDDNVVFRREANSTDYFVRPYVFMYGYPI